MNAIRAVRDVMDYLGEETKPEGVNAGIIFAGFGEALKVVYDRMSRGIEAEEQPRSVTLIVAGIPQAVAMKITGHKTDSMFRRYAIVNEEQKREAFAKTQQHLAASAGRKIVSMGGGK